MGSRPPHTGVPPLMRECPPVWTFLGAALGEAGREGGRGRDLVGEHITSNHAQNATPACFPRFLAQHPKYW